MSRQAEFSQRLRREMYEQRLTIAALSRKSGVDERSIARYRAGNVMPVDSFGDPSDNAVRIARALGVDVGELLGSDDVETVA